MSHRDRSPVRTTSPRQPSGKDHWDQLSPYTLTLMQLEETAGSSGQRGTGELTESGFSQGFFSILSPMVFWFLVAVASGLLSWGHFIYSDIIDLIAQILFKLNWAGWCHHKNQYWKLNWKLSVKSCNFTLLTQYFPILILCSCFITICIVKSIYITI